MVDAMTHAEELQSRATRDLNEKFEEQPTLADRFEEDHHRLNASLLRIPPRASEKMQRKPIRDLKAAIGINERFLSSITCLQAIRMSTTKPLTRSMVPQTSRLRASSWKSN